MSATAIAILENKIKEWMVKKSNIESFKKQLDPRTQPLEVTAYDLILDQVNEMLMDLKETREHIENITAYQESAVNLITNQLKKKSNGN